MRFDLDDAYKYKNRPFHSATPLFHAPNLLLFLNYFSRTVEDGFEKKGMLLSGRMKHSNPESAEKQPSFLLQTP
jgi:hypothetical protein